MREKAAMANEHTALLETVHVAPPRQRYSHGTIRRFCTVALTSSLVIIVALFLLPLRFLPSSHRRSTGASWYFPWSSSHPHRAWPASEGVSYKDLQDILLTTPQEDKIKHWSEYYTAGPHLAGKNFSQALWTKDRWQDFGVDSNIVTYDVYVNYPAGHRLALLEKTSKGKRDWVESTGTGGDHDYKVKYEARLEEDVLEEDPTTGLENRIPTFHGYSASGNVTAPYVYVNFGTYQDFEDILKANVSLKGKIALVKYGHIFRGLKVKRAQELGMIGTVIYTDPEEDGEITEANGYKTYPDGPARNPSSVQRGSTQFLTPGDPTTPGYPSKPGVPRQDTGKAIPFIPSIPISYLDALPLLKALNGHGPKAADFPERWRHGGLGYKGVDYNIGPSPDNLVLNLVNEQEYVTTPMWNVIGIINGTLPDEVVVLGNHRDAWIAGGAGDPNSGSAAMNEVVRSFGKALEKGWKPLRTIVFASWDGEEYGLIGSTEWVEEYLPWLSASAIAYLNVDVSTRGPNFQASASPLLNKALYEATSLVQSPNQTTKGQTVGDLWSGRIATMGSGSDFTSFQDYAGIPSVDLGFGNGPHDPVYHYHSNYDSFAWMDKYGDPGWHYHVAITKVWALLAARLVETPIIQFNATDYATGLHTYLQRVRDKANALNPSPDFSRSFEELERAIANLHNATTSFDAHAATLASSLDSSVPWWKWWKKVKLYLQVKAVNDRYKLFERQFLYQEGLDGRNWFKHVVFAPGLWTGYSGATFPGLVESVEARDAKGVKRWSRILVKLVDQAAESLR
ncbi:hypothetical protein MMC16_007520 [Acarospora aff. strigata]|nr:hypothetical protein [Acarospora aff. strigata]